MFSCVTPLRRVECESLHAEPRGNRAWTVIQPLGAWFFLVTLMLSLITFCFAPLLSIFAARNTQKQLALGYYVEAKFPAILRIMIF